MVSELSDRKLLEIQSSLRPKERFAQRLDPELAKFTFGIDFPLSPYLKYYFWDNTTVSFKKALIKYGLNKKNILEIGTGPFATLSRYLESQNSNCKLTASEVDLQFLESANRTKSLVKSEVKIVKSNLYEKLSGQYDLIFSNPPYANPSQLAKVSIHPGTAEFQAGYGGPDGTKILIGILSGLEYYLDKDGVCLIGINNKYLNDDTFKSVINLNDKIYLAERFYSKRESPPFSQIYVLKKLQKTRTE